MKVKFSAGAEADILSEPEYRAGVDAIRGSLSKLDTRLADLDTPPIMLTPSQALQTDAGGNIGGGATGQGFELYRCVEGRAARVVRLSIADATHTPAAPLTAGWLAFYVNVVSPTTLAAAVPPAGSTQVLPLVFTDGSHSATMIRNGERLIVVGAALPASATIGVHLQIWQYGTDAPTPRK